MGSDLLRRVRWSNVARAVAAVVVVAAVVAWPRLGPPRPRVPDPAPQPLVTTPGEPRVGPPNATGVTRPVRRGTKPRWRGTGPGRRVKKPGRRVTRLRGPMTGPRRGTTPRRRHATRPRRAHPGREGGGAGGPVVGGGTSAPVVVGAAPAPAPAARPTPTRDPTQAEFGFERWPLSSSSAHS